jgi:hypothetical protein
MAEPLSWVALEHEHIERHPDWFWMLGIVALGGAVLALIIGNVLFALFIVIAAVTLALHALRHPRPMAFEINDRGVLIDIDLYPYQTLESYCIHEHGPSFRLLIKSQKLFMPYLHIPLADVPPLEVRKALLHKLPEVYVQESLSEKLMERIGL